MRKILFFIVLFSVVIFANDLYAEKWKPETIQMVHLQDAKRYVCNPDGVLNQSTVDSVDLILYALERDKGVQTVVVVVKQLDGDNPYQFGMSLGKRYGIGDEKKRTGLILILATEDRSYQILTGNGLEGTISDAISRRIQNRIMVPALKRGEWDRAILETIKSIDGYIRGDESLQNEGEDSLGNILIALTFMAFFLVFVYAIFVQGKRRTCPKCGNHKLILKSRKEVTVGGRIKIQECWHCKSCGYEETKNMDKPHDNMNENGSNGPGGLWIPPVWGNSGGGSGSVGGSFGGGTFGGGGSGGRF